MCFLRARVANVLLILEYEVKQAVLMENLYN